MFQVSITCVGAFRAVGVLLVLALLTGPPLIARRFSHHLRTVLMLAFAVSAACSFGAVAITRDLLSIHGMPLYLRCIRLLDSTVLYSIPTSRTQDWRMDEMAQEKGTHYKPLPQTT